MTDNQLAPFNALFPTSHTDPNRRSRLKKFTTWLNDNGKGWHDARLDEYRDYLLHRENLAPISVRNHIATIRQRYRDVLEDNQIIETLETAAFLDCQRNGYEPNPANVQAVVNKWIRHISNNISPRKAQVKVLKVQDHEDDKFTWLTPDEIDERINAIPFNTKLGWRNAAAIALAYGCALREAEVVAVTVDDLYQTFKGAPALRVKSGKGGKKRMVVYGDQWRYIEDYVLPWLAMMGIESGRVLRSFDVNTDEMSKSCSVDTVQDAVKKHMGVKPHDLRRSYAYNMWKSGIELEVIRLQLGHEHIQTTLGYIGNMNAEDRM